MATSRAGDVTNTVAALDYYLPGLGFAAVDQLLIFAFYAQERHQNARAGRPALHRGLRADGLDRLGSTHLGFRGLALADSAKQIVHAVVLFWLLWRWQGSLAGFGLGRTALKIAVAAAGQRSRVRAWPCILARDHPWGPACWPSWPCSCGAGYVLLRRPGPAADRRTDPGRRAWGRGWAGAALSIGLPLVGRHERLTSAQTLTASVA